MNLPEEKKYSIVAVVAKIWDAAENPSLLAMAATFLFAQ
jgi:hypothetical protein